MKYYKKIKCARTNSLQINKVATKNFHGSKATTDNATV